MMNGIEGTCEQLRKHDTIRHWKCKLKLSDQKMRQNGKQ